MSSSTRNVFALVLSMSLAGALPQILEADVVHNDELIVNGGGICAGVGCATGDADNLGGIRIKSTSPLVWFEDTGGGISGDDDWWILANGAFGEESFKVLNVDNATTPFIILGSGNVGIGTTSPSSKLHVSGGDIRVSSGSFIDDGTTLNVPDYVFEPGYKMLSLDELGEFVQREKHLPNVPKAAEIKATGLDLSQFQMRLLEKVEELTLYTLELNGENEDLRERLTALERLLEDKQ